jgi:hypothetical protein
MLGSLILKRANTSRLSGQWSDDDYDVLENGVVVGRIFLSAAAPPGECEAISVVPLWLRLLVRPNDTRDKVPPFGTRTHGYEPTREARWQRSPGAGNANGLGRATQKGKFRQWNKQSHEVPR